MMTTPIPSASGIEMLMIFYLDGGSVFPEFFRACFLYVQSEEYYVNMMVCMVFFVTALAKQYD